MRRSIPALVFLTAAALLSAAPTMALPDEPAPKLGALNRHVLKVIDSFPRDGAHLYSWPKDGSYAGVTEDLVYQGKVVAKGNSRREAYCCGLTFEVFFKAWRSWAEKKKRPFSIGGLTPEGLKRLRTDWYCAGGDRTGPVKALVDRGLGQRIERLQDARPGDFVQLWRHSGSGHSVIFVAWERDRAGTVTGLRYWSTQKSTKGIGFRVERFAGKSGIKRDELYIARVGRS